MALPGSRAGRDRANQSIVAGVGDPSGRWARLSDAEKSEECRMLRFDPIWPPSSVSEALVSGAAWASVCFSVLVSQLALPSVSRLALQSQLALPSVWVLVWGSSHQLL